MGYQEKIIINELNDLNDLRLIESDDQIADIEDHPLTDTDNNISISLKGYYYLNELKNRFFYIDLILQDTPIYDIEIFSKIKSEFPLADGKGYRNLNYRKNCVNYFLEYLRKQETTEKNPQIPYLFGFSSEIIQTIRKRDLPQINAVIKVRYQQ